MVLFVYNGFDTQSLQITQAHLYYLQLELAQMLFNAKNNLNGVVLLLLAYRFAK